MKDFGKENNAGASAAIGRGDYDRQSVVTNTMQKVVSLFLNKINVLMNLVTTNSTMLDSRIFSAVCSTLSVMFSYASLLMDSLRLWSTVCTLFWVTSTKCY